MLINLRNALMAGKRLPYDAEVEYAYFDSSYIDTGIDYFPDFRILAGTNGNVRNVTIRCDDNHLLERMSSTTPYWSIVAGDTSGSRITTDVPVSGVHFIELYNGSVKADGASYGTIPNRTWASGVRCRIPRDANTYQFYLYSAKLYDESHNLVRDYIPVRVSVNGAAVGALYDRANPHGGPNRNGLYFSSLNPLVCGPDVVPVEYIESHGTEWIDTGVIGNSSTKVELKAQGANTSVTQTLCGGRDSNGRYSFAVWQRSVLDGAYGMRWDYLATNTGGGGGYILDGIWNTTQPNSVVKDGANNYLNGVQLGANASNSFSCNFPLALFAMNTGGSKGNFFVGKMFMCKIFNNNTPTRNYTPVRVGTDATSWEGAMMDTLTRRIYRNAGTGAFGYGNDLKYPIPAS